jgi:DNA (cytosine-5)-methyltransferase 1
MYKVLDLFCGAGGAAMGLHRAWSDALIVGVDIHPQPRYPFTFVQADAMRPPFDLREFDFIWASPPCQAYSVTRSMHVYSHPELVEPVREMLERSGALYVIENVVGAPLNYSVSLCGSLFGLNVRRHRLFESNRMLMQSSCRHDLVPEPLEICGTGGPGGRHRKPRNLGEAQTAMGIDWMGRKELNQAIPPAYSEYIARQIRKPLDSASAT